MLAAMGQLVMRRPSLADLPPLASPHGYALRQARADDAEGLAALLVRAFNDPWDAARATRDLLAAPDVLRTFLVLSGDAVVATASAQLVPKRWPGSGVLHWVATDPAHAGHRLGRLASLAALHALRDHGCGDARLLTDDHRLPAVRTYLGLGFEPEPVEADHAERWTAVRARLAG
jgi:mycothiol synthase